jgi:hypothetical protein
MRSLKGKTLFITGASRGIGRANAHRAAADGANIAIASKTDCESAPKFDPTFIRCNSLIFPALWRNRHQFGDSAPENRTLRSKHRLYEGGPSTLCYIKRNAPVGGGCAIMPDFPGIERIQCETEPAFGLTPSIDVHPVDIVEGTRA